jgi:thiamine pyrophosphate-dependent acetolactate synthase large subunit-like protein
MQAMQVSEAVGTVLARLGVARVFGLVGSGNFAVTQALSDAGASFVAARHECAAVTMADAYARVSGEVGVCSVHQGPGLTNAVTGLTEAAKSRTPLLVLAADVPAAALRSNFRVDQAGLVTSVGAVPERVYGPESALADAARALRRARVERRPVVLMLPLDIQAQPFPGAVTVPDDGPEIRLPRPAAEAVAAVADLVVAAGRPAIVAGRGAVLAGAREPLERVGDMIGAILATSANGNGLFAGNPWAVGISGGFASPLAQRRLADADLVLAFGAGLNHWTTRHGTLVGPHASVVQVDVEPTALAAHRPADVAVVGDAALTAWALCTELAERQHRRQGFRTAELAEEIRTRRWRDEPYDDAGTGTSIDPRTLSIALDDLLPADRTVAIDSGHFMGFPAMYLTVPDAAGFVFTQAFQSIGLGLASAIGAALARPDRVTVAALGDGGALMALGELETAARLRLPMLVVVYNDAAYGAEVHHFGPMGHPVDLVRFPDTDFAALGRAVGAAGVTVRRPADLGEVKSWLTDPDRPLVLDAKVTPTVVAEWLKEAFR